MSDEGAICCAWAQERLEPYLDGELPAAEASALQTHLHSCSACATELQRAERVLAGLRALPVCACPPHVAAAAWARLQALGSHQRRQRARDWLDGWLVPHWRVAGAATVGLVLVLAAGYQHTRAAARAREVARAQAQVEWTLAYVGELGRRTGLTVREQVVRPHVVAPVQRAAAAAGQRRSL
ncbi:MAG: zf-HC2 domain-containing protein [Candidatus Latescibacterota bacterium]